MNNRKRQEIIDTTLVVVVRIVAMVAVVKVERWIFQRLGIAVVAICPMGR